MRKSQSPTAEAVAGCFNPKLPGDSQEVLRLYAIAARAVNSRPEALDEISDRLVVMGKRLVAPEAVAAQECQRLWRLFARVAQVPKQALRNEAGRAYFRDLDALSQRLDLPPLSDWEDLPEGIDDPQVSPWADYQTQETNNLEAAREEARQLVLGLGKHQVFPAENTMQLLLQLGNGERRRILEQLVGQGGAGAQRREPAHSVLDQEREPAGPRRDASRRAAAGGALARPLAGVGGLRGVVLCGGAG